MSLALSQSWNQHNFQRPMIQNHVQKHYPHVLFLRCKPGGDYALVFEGQSEGGKATLQKLGAGRVNSTATVGGPVSSLFTETTQHSCCSPLPVFCKRSLCLRATMPFRANSAPCALTTIVFVLSENCGPSCGGLWTTTETLRSIRWLRRFFNQRLALVSFSSDIQNQDKSIFLSSGEKWHGCFQAGHNSCRSETAKQIISSFP